MAGPASLRSILDALDDPALLVENGRLLIANQAARGLFGRAIEGSDIRLAIRHPSALERIASGQASDIEVGGIGQAERLWLLSTRPVGEGLTLVRLSDRSAARAAERMRVDFVANASHELRTPLATILGYAETIADGGLEPDAHARFGQVIRLEAQRMLRIIEDLMGLSRIEADRFIAPRDVVSIADVVQLAVSNCQPLAAKRSCAIEVDIDEDLPPVRGDRAQLDQLMDNLLSNALRYGSTAAGGIVRISGRVQDRFVLLSVADSGDGIAPEHLPRLTERFYRVDDARSRDSGGTGLGLAIVKHIVERHRGRLDIRSEPGQGTEVTVRLPVD